MAFHMPAPSAIAELRARFATVKIPVSAFDAETLHSCRVRVCKAHRSSAAETLHSCRVRIRKAHRGSEMFSIIVLRPGFAQCCAAGSTLFRLCSTLFRSVLFRTPRSVPPLGDSPNPGLGAQGGTR